MMEGIVRGLFQTVLEWYIGLENGWNIGTNKCGRYLKKYIDKDLWRKIEETKLRYQE